jgi:hypothetical protein
LACFTAAKPFAFFKDTGPTFSVNPSIDTAASTKRRIRGIHHRIANEAGDITLK